MKYQSLLVLAPHTDDAELGCGGTIARFLEEGMKIHVAAFSTAEDSLPAGAPPNTLGEEFRTSMNRLGIPEQSILTFNFPVRRFSYQRQELLEEIIQLRRRIKPEMVMLPSANDLHQDHQVLHAEGLRAFKEITVWGYELPWNQIQFLAQAFVVLERRHIDLKWKALTAYKTQLELEREYFRWEFVEGLARVRGTQIKQEYAEAFEAIRVKW